MDTDIRSFRLRTDLLKDAKKYNINIRALVEMSLEKMMHKKKCPTCGSVVKKQRKKTT